MTAWRKVMNAFGIGQTSTPTNETNGTQSVQIVVYGAASAVKDPAPSLQSFGFASAPMVGANVAVIHLGGDPTKAVVIASDDPRYRPTDLQPGEAKVYGASGAFVHIKADGSINVTPAAGKPTIVNSELRVTGDVIAGYGGSDQVGLQTHTHGGVTSGASSTAAPTAGT